MPAPIKRALLLVISAPSGTGKSTLCDRLLSESPNVTYSISCTTRPPRGNEINGVHYHFLSDDDFLYRVHANDFLEHAVVHQYRYGTLSAHVMQALIAGHDVLMDIDVQGARQIRNVAAITGYGEMVQRSLVDIFITPPSLAALRMRLQKRGVDSPESIEQRLLAAQQEMSCWREYQYLIINDQFAEAYQQLVCIIRAEHCRINVTP